MRSVQNWIFLVVVYLLAAVPLSAQQPASPPIGVTSSMRNPLQIAILHWYNANQTTSFAVGTLPTFVAFDGANIWVTTNPATT